MKSLSHLNKYLLKYKWRLILGISFIIVSKLFAIYPAQVIRKAFDAVANHIKIYQNQDVSSLTLEELESKILLYAGLVIGSSIAYGLLLFFTRQTIIIMSRLIEFDLKTEIFNHYQKLNLSFYKRNNTGDLMNRISEDVGHVRMYVGPAIMYSINLIVMFILVITAMLSVNYKLTFYCLFPLPFLSLSIYYVSNIINKKSERVQNQLSTLSTYVQEAFSGIRILKAYSQQEKSISKFNTESESYKTIQMELVKTDAIFQPMMILLIGLSTILTIYIGGILCINGEITPGNIAEFVIYVNMLTWPVAALGWVTSLTQRAAASQKRINEFLQTQPEIINPTNIPTHINGNIEFENVTFVYPDTGITALKDISFTLKKGESVAIVGKTGSGKSTIANLLLRLYDTSNGTIYFDSKNITEINLSSLRSNIGYVPQDVFLFSDSIYANIGFGTSSELNTPLIKQAAKDACVYIDIINFPNKFNTLLGERGITLSGGQKQRVSIARALYKSPSILIFDDCLSAVDTQTEDIIIKNLQRLMKNKTTLIISHRVSSVKHADRIIVLENGKIIETGTHQSLIDKKGAYLALYTKQLLEEEKSSI